MTQKLLYTIITDEKILRQSRTRPLSRAVGESCLKRGMDKAPSYAKISFLSTNEPIFLLYWLYMKHLLVRLTLFVVLLASLVFFVLSRPVEPLEESSLESVTGTTLESAYTNASPDLIKVSSPVPGETISSPITITGEARGTWYFEASAPVVLVNWDGLIIAEGYVMATEDWMTEAFVPFEGTLEFTKEVEADSNVFLYPRGALILKNDNPSGLPENDRAIEIPILFE